MSAVVGPEMDAQRRANALRAFHTLPREDRHDVLALARQGRRHPDERVAAVAWWYAAAVLQPRWFNRMPVWLPLLVGVACFALALLTPAWWLVVPGIAAVLGGGSHLRQRMTLSPLLRMMRAPGQDG